MNQFLNLDEGKKAVKLARSAIETYAREKKKIEPRDEGGKYGEKRGVFVTINENGDLRGCIGRPLPTQSLGEGLIESAISAGFRDPRFPGLEEKELEDITIEVSILTQPEKIEVEDPKERTEEVETGRDGLIARSHGREGLLLPQVAVDRGWDAEEFLSQTCVKAGLPPDSWLKKEVEFEKFSAQIFKETEPGGEVIEEEIRA